MEKIIRRGEFRFRFLLKLVQPPSWPPSVGLRGLAYEVTQQVVMNGSRSSRRGWGAFPTSPNTSTASVHCSAPLCITVHRISATASPTHLTDSLWREHCVT